MSLLLKSLGVGLLCLFIGSSIDNVLFATGYIDNRLFDIIFAFFGFLSPMIYKVGEFLNKNLKNNTAASYSIETGAYELKKAGILNECELEYIVNKIEGIKISEQVETEYDQTLNIICLLFDNNLLSKQQFDEKVQLLKEKYEKG